MILALFGTSSHHFVRLMDALVSFDAQSDEELFVQAGSTPLPSTLQGIAFLSPDALEQKIKSASLVISQGGFGSMRDVLHAGIPLVAIPRLEELNEAKGNQTVLVQALEKSGVIVPLYDIKELPAAVQRARTSVLKAPPTSSIPGQLAALVDDWLGAACSV